MPMPGIIGGGGGPPCLASSEVVVDHSFREVTAAGGGLTIPGGGGGGSGRIPSTGIVKGGVSTRTSRSSSAGRRQVFFAGSTNSLRLCRKMTPGELVQWCRTNLQYR